MATYYATVAGAGAKNGAAWATAFDLAALETHVEGSAAAGDLYYVAGGTYTLTGNWNTALDGTAASPIHFIGVKSGTTNEPPIVSDWADDTDRPLFAAAANECRFDNYWIIRNIRVTTTEDDGFRADTGSLIVNCYSNNSSNADRIAIKVAGDQSRIIDCEAESGGATKGRCIGLPNAAARVIGCYCHDGSDGIVISLGAVISFNIIDTMDDTGINGGNDHAVVAMNNTIYNCSVGISETIGTRWVVMNNIISDCTTGISWDTEQKSNYFDFNNYYNNTADVSNVTKGPNATAYEPQYTGAGDFSLNTASDCIGAAFSIELGVG